MSGIHKIIKSLLLSLTVLLAPATLRGDEFTYSEYLVQKPRLEKAIDGYSLKLNEESAYSVFRGFKNNPVAEVYLAFTFRYGHGVERNILDYDRILKTSFPGVRRFAYKGDPLAQHVLGTIYFSGHGVKRDYDKALEWFSKAASQNFAWSQYNLGVMYRTGTGVALNYSKAFKWFHKAAALNHPWAQHNLGYMYEQGEGVAPNRTKAREWYNKCEAQGLACKTGQTQDEETKPEEVVQDVAGAMKGLIKQMKKKSADAQKNTGY